MRARLTAAALLIALLLPATGLGQAPVRPGPWRSVAVEALGGTAGSLVGLGVLSAARPCDVEDLSCLLRGVGVASTVGAATGSYLAGRIAATRPSALGALAGAAVGVLVGAGTAKLAQEARLPEAATVLAFAAGQGVISALGSRLARR